MNDAKGNIKTIEVSEVKGSFPKYTKDYSEILSFYGLDYKQVDHSLQIGKIEQVQGWIIHLSVIISQTTELFKIIIPVLIEEQVPFKIAEDHETCFNLLNGSLGIGQIGKIVSIYPDNDQEALHLAKKLIDLTGAFQGPAIPTDRLLGNIVYTRYGSFNPVLQPDRNGKNVKYIYNKNNELICDPYSIPFQLPDGVTWPFSAIKEAEVPPKSKTLKNIYRPVSYLKEDTRGNVYKAVYLKKWYLAKSCVIKQGKKNMYSDEKGRDITDRLKWQQELHQRLEGIIPLPRIIDYFIEEEDSYLVMEYIKGEAVQAAIKKINNQSKGWFALELNKQLLIMDIVIRIVSTIEKLHENGIVHRDIVPVNFMIDKKNRLFLIDLELAYSLFEKKPIPPFDLGTPGFMSPEQQCIAQPTVKEDIYGLGALMVESFTGITPSKFGILELGALKKAFSGLLQHEELGNVIADCLHHLPEKRPTVKTISATLHRYQNWLVSGHIRQKIKLSIDSSRDAQLQELITDAVNGLVQPPIVLNEDLWYSKMKTVANQSSPMHKDYTRYVGFCEGISGVLYLLARVKKIGISIAPCIYSYQKGWDYIFNQYNSLSPVTNPGLYNGFAGVALAIAEGLNSQLLPKDTVTLNYLQDMLSLAVTDISVANGLAGQGIAILFCKQYLPQEMVKAKLKADVEQIIKEQQQDGSWTISLRTKQDKLSFRYGTTGIIWFLLEYISHYPNTKIKEPVQKALSWLLKNVSPSSTYKGIDKQRGIVLTLLKAYECLQLDDCKKMAEKALHQYPTYISFNQWDQQSGLAGMGELYLEAAQVLKNEEWEKRANWIANVLLYTFKKSAPNIGYWQMEDLNFPTADFMTGNTGIIHFLARYAAAKKLGYRLLT